jgi:mutator protein MutT
LRVGQEVQALSRRLAASERLTESASSSAHGPPAIQVAAAVIFDRRRRVLIAQRPAGKHLAGSWEFPGGKIEPGETRTVALARELKEELGITIEHPRPLLRLRHAYPEGEVLLDVWVVRRYQGEPRGLDGQALRWCSCGELPEVELLPADQPIVKALRLPESLRQAVSPAYEIVACAELHDAPPGRRHTRADGPTALNPARGRPRRLLGSLCGRASDAQGSAAAADFLVMGEPLPHDELLALCAGVDLPVYAWGIALERAWVLGATGVNLIAQRV